MPRQTKKFQATATKGIIWARVSSREQEDGYLCRRDVRLWRILQTSI